MSDDEAQPWPPKIAELIMALDAPLTSPSPEEWARTLRAALGERAMSYLSVLATRVRDAGLMVVLGRIIEIAVHLIGDGALPDALDSTKIPAAKADAATPHSAREALGKPKGLRGVGLRR